jgi:hypothetical protein
MYGSTGCDNLIPGAYCDGYFKWQTHNNDNIEILGSNPSHQGNLDDGEIKKKLHLHCLISGIANSTTS